MMGSRVSHYSFLTFSSDRRARIVFPGGPEVPLQSGEIATAGYVRSETRARVSKRARDGVWRSGDAIPFRDYPPCVLVDIRQVEGEWREGSHAVFGCRNVLNEWGYQARINERWWRRHGDAPVPSHWPVLAVDGEHLGMVPLDAAQRTGTDILTGLPLVRQGVASTRSFIVAHCSDVTHSYELHPAGPIGVSEEVWRELSCTWQQLRDEGHAAGAIAERMEALAARHGVGPSRNKLHSVLGQRTDGSMLALAIVGPLDGIARLLQSEWQVRDAIVLDNGGSVGWLYFDEMGDPARLLVAGPNHRPPGTCFLSVGLGGFPQPQTHPSIDL